MKSIKPYQFSTEFREICAPIFALSPITFCSIGRVFLDGTYTGFMSDPAWTQMYLEKYYESTITPWLEAEIAQQGDYELWSMYSVFKDSDPNLKSLKENIMNSNNCHNGIHFIDKYPQYFELIRFATPKIDGIDSFFIEKQQLLRQFILLIKEKIEQHPLLSREFNMHYVLPVALNTDILNRNNHSTMALLEIEKYYVGFPLQEGRFLTRNEVRCLIPYLMGVPKKDIAKQCHITTRTIEKHIEHIKDKSIYQALGQLRPLFLNNKFISSMSEQVLDEFIKKSG